MSVASVPDLLRLLTLPVFGYVAWLDVKTRRVPNRTWLPLAALALVLLAWEAFAVTVGDATPFEQRVFYIQAGLSIGFIIPLSYLFWLLGGFGGADAKAFFVIALLFPTYPEFALFTLGVEGTAAVLPVIQTTVGVFSLTILSNTVVVGALYPVVLAGRNATTGYVSPGMFVAKPVRWDDTIDEYGTMLEFADRRLVDDLSLSGLRSYFAWRGLDLDALRMYLQWRGCSLADLREAPEQYRNPGSLPAEPNPPGDGAIATDGGNTTDRGEEPASGPEPDSEPALDDPWGAEAFLEDIDGSAYGTTPERLRRGLETLVSDDVVWISPGIPFLVPLFVGLLVAFTYGDLLFALFGALGIG